MFTATTVRGALHQFAELVIELIRQAYEHDRYPLDRGRSNMLKTLDYDITQPRATGGQFKAFDASSFQLYAADYLRYVVSGRKPGVKKVPIAALIAWIKANNIGAGNLPRASIRTRVDGKLVRKRAARGRFIDRNAITDLSINRLAFAIQNAIYKRGIRPRPYVQISIDAASQELNVWLDERALDALTFDVDQALNLDSRG